MPSIRTIRNLHRWLALLIGVQLFLWSLSGLYMVVTDIDFIHGDHLVEQGRAPTLQTETIAYDMDSLLKNYPGAEQVRLQTSTLGPFYSLRHHGEKLRISAVDGSPMALLSEQDARKVAIQVYTGTGQISEARLFSEEAPAEVSPRLLPLWQINFDDAGNSSLYVSAIEGRVVTKRHTGWRLFDVMWMLHIMDYDSRENIHNLLLQSLATLGIITALMGAVLAWRGLRSRNQGPKGWQRFHLWLGAIVGLQFILWLGSGLALSLLDEEWLDGNRARLRPSTAFTTPTRAVSELLGPSTQNVELSGILNRPVYKLQQLEQQPLYWADTLTPLTLDKAQLRQLAAASIASPLELGIDLLPGDETGYPGTPTVARFVARDGTRILLDAGNGRILEQQTPGSDLKSVLMMMHFMDYMPGDGIHFNHLPIRLLAILTLLLSISGWVLVFRQLKAGQYRLTLLGRGSRFEVRDRDGALLGHFDSHGSNLLDSINHQTELLLTQCGGGGSCGLCVLKCSEPPPANDKEKALLRPSRLEQGLRLACQHSHGSGYYQLASPAQARHWLTQAKPPLGDQALDVID
ncbi:PepSY domain-containing protein [Shewanella sedimentimangrovi]|uniref:PepSY domain-containing protein n=1 Tax=Shewanella sedimentimangrovi TaxID=2814293 RepID=A0ABX7R280_9GAMM|nr:PepSY domain-containing protein [Shewanella sedimentimangrovi]QSX37594.1 PepSY domain-containing protein [Shewanella sedimentimangrovi]